MRNSDDAALRAILKYSAPKVKTGTCKYCGRDLISRRPDTKFCSGRCRTAACVKDKPSRKTIIATLVAENAALKAELAKLLADSRTNALTTEARQAKVRREEEKARRLYARRMR